MGRAAIDRVKTATGMLTVPSRIASSDLVFKSAVLLLFLFLALGARANAPVFELDGRFLSNHDPGWMKIQLVTPEADKVQLLQEPECANDDFDQLLECWDEQHEWWEAARAEKKMAGGAVSLSHYSI